MSWPSNGHYAHFNEQYRHPMVIVNSPSRHQTTRFTPYPQFDGAQDQGSNHNYASTSQQTPIINTLQHVDYRILVLSLSDQYIKAARKIAALIAHNQDGADIEQYHDLISTGLHFLHARVSNPQLSGASQAPRPEAVLQLRYATLLYEETVDYGLIEETLNKSIMFCHSHRFLDLKYSMHHLLTRTLSKTNVRAALKHLDEIISECETLRLKPWIYAFQFLRCSLLLTMQTPRDLQAALNGLRSITDLARHQKDPEIAIGACLMLASLYLRVRREDSATETQRALATARGLLSNFDPKDSPQLHILIQELDLAGSLDPYDHHQAPQKARDMRHFVDDTLGGSKWRRDRTFILHLNTSGFENVLAETGGIFRSTEGDAALGLSFSWVGRHEAYMLAMILSGIAGFQRNGKDGHKSEQYLNDALDGTKDNPSYDDAPTEVSLTVACEKAETRRILRLIILLQLASAYIGRSEWALAKRVLTRYRNEQVHCRAVFDGLNNMSKYLDAVVRQSTDELDTALKIYITLQEQTKIEDTSTLDANKIIGLLSAVNALLIVRIPSHPQHGLAVGLVDSLQRWSPVSKSDRPGASLVAQHEGLAAAIAFAIAVSSDTVVIHSEDATGVKGVVSNSIVTTKQTLSVALRNSQKSGNYLLMSLCLSYMHEIFFNGISDKQAHSLVQGAAVQAKESCNQNWVRATEGKCQRLRQQHESDDIIKQE